MHQIKHSAIVPYRCEDMYHLVNHVQDYPEFIPHCSKTEIHEHTPNHMIASIYLKKGPFSYSFKTKNICHFPSAIYLELLEGPFSELHGHWSFESLQKGELSACKVSLELKFEIKNSLLNQAFGKLFDNIANKMLDAFCQRASELHQK